MDDKKKEGKVEHIIDQIYDADYNHHNNKLRSSVDIMGAEYLYEKHLKHLKEE